MNLTLKSIADKGNPQKERVVIRVAQNTDVGSYLLLCTGFIDGKVNTGVTDTFWFPDKEVGAGDLVVLYSKTGKTNEKTLENGTKVHFFYWGTSGSRWSSPESGVVLLNAPEWEGSDAKAL